MHLQDTGHPDLQGLVGHDVVGDGHQGVVTDIQPLEEREAGEHPGGQRPQTLSSLLLLSLTMKGCVCPSVTPFRTIRFKHLNAPSQCSAVTLN